MSAIIGKAGKSLFTKHVQQYAPVDPYYEYYINDKGKEKRRRRSLPLGLSARDKSILLSVQKRAHRLDKGFRLFGIRFGYTFFISLIPIVGDCTDAFLNYTLIVKKARRAEIPDWLLQRMLFNNAVSAGVSFVPVVGDVVLAVWKANSRNAALLEEYLRVRGQTWIEMGGVELVESEVPEGEGENSKQKHKISKHFGKRSKLEEIKPGAGRKKGEVIPIAPEETVQGNKKLKKAAKGPTTTSATTTAVATTSTAGTPPDTSTSQDAKRSGSKRSVGKPSFFGSLLSKGSRAPPAGEKGRFVENVETPSDFPNDK